VEEISLKVLYTSYFLHAKMTEALTNGHSANGITSNRSVVWVAPSNVDIQHHDVKELGEEDVLVEVISTGICGSDAHVWESNPAKAPPVLGHESAGKISKVGSKVTSRTVGQRVAIEPGFACMKWVNSSITMETETDSTEMRVLYSWES
jgi:D-xylulose reductase